MPVSAQFKSSKRAFTTAGPGRRAEPSPLAEDIAAAMGDGNTYEAVVASRELAEGIVKELNRAARQVTRNVTGSGGVELRTATVKTEIITEGTKFVVLWQAFAPVAKRIPKPKTEAAA